MNNYKTTVVKNNPDYVNKFLLLSNKNRDGLFKTTNDEIVQLKIDSNGSLQCSFIKNGGKNTKDYSLRKIGIDFLGKRDPSVESMLKYLITPEMEIERIFNNIRFKYLQSILFSKIEKPSEKITARFNKAFQAFAGIKIYQGNTKNRVDNDEFWKNAGFKKDAQNKISFEEEFEELDFIIKYLRSLNLENYNKLYAELIAIKPGFHEIYIHENYFNENETYRNDIENKDSERDKVFKLLRGYGNVENIFLTKLKPNEINSKNYFSYAPCNVTEGPFVFRKRISVSYFNEIQKIHQKEELKNLKENFHILDYYHKKPRTIEELEKILEKAEQFKKYMSD